MDGDLFWIARPPRAIPWLEGVMGCSIRYSVPYSIFTEPIIDDWAQSPQREPGPLFDNPWFRKLVEFLEGLARLSEGRFPVAVPNTRGPWDLVCALRGTRDAYLNLYDHPAELMCLADMCARFWIEVTRCLAEVIPMWCGGYVGLFGVWAPEFTPTPQNDSSVSVSAWDYRRHMQPADSRTTQAWRFPMFHLHSAGCHIVDSVLSFLDGCALNIVIDSTGPALDRLLPIFHRVQKRRTPLHLVTTDRRQLEELTAALSPIGLAITYVPAADAASAGEEEPDCPTDVSDRRSNGTSV